MEKHRILSKFSHSSSRKTHDTSPAFNVERSSLSLSLDFQSNDISTPTLPSIPIFEGIGFLQSRKSSSARVSICFPLFSTRDLETCGRNQKRGGTAPRGSRRLRSPLIYFSTRVCSFSPKCRDPSSA